MDKDAYIKQLENKIVELEKRIEELERLLGMNSKNSFKPPSSDPPGVSAISAKRKRTQTQKAWSEKRTSAVYERAVAAGKGNTTY